MDTTLRDSNNRKKTKLLAIDALYFYKESDQWNAFNIERELNKAYCGFLTNQSQTFPIATGNWVMFQF